MIGQLLDHFARGDLIRPSHHRPNLVHLVRAVASLAGVGDIDRTGATQDLIDLIGPSDHLVFVLLDGLGMNLMRELPDGSFLASHLRRELLATCPSTTACALTSLATGEYPSRHGVTGWFTHLPELELTATILPFVERISGVSLIERGIRPENVLPLPVLCPRMKHEPLTVVPSLIANTAYNLYSRGRTAGWGYVSIANAIDQIITHATTTRHPTYTHLYLPEVDSVCHKQGLNSDKVRDIIGQIDAELARLADALKSRARIVISADHGLVEVPRPDQTILFATDPLLELLKVPPTGDARMPLFHVRPGQHREFVELFTQRFGNRMVLLNTDQVEELELLGPGKLSPIVRARLGDFAAIPFGAATLAYHPPHKPLGTLYVAVHAGLSRDEMLVPLCLAGG